MPNPFKQEIKKNVVDLLLRGYCSVMSANPWRILPIPNSIATQPPIQTEGPHV